MWSTLKSAGINPAPDRSEVTWSQFLHSQAAVACDFFTVDTALLRRYYVLFFIDLPTRQVFYAVGQRVRRTLDRLQVRRLIAISES